MSGFFYNLGRYAGRAAVPAIRKSKWIWAGLAGTEEEALRAEIALGNAMAVEVRGMTEPVNDPAPAVLVRDICDRLSAGLRDKGRTFRCEVIRDDAPNAMALPGGLLFVSHSLVSLCEGQPDEVAFVIGHEMAHVVRGHVWDRTLNETALRAVSAVTARAGPLGGWLRQKGLGLLRSAHSQTCEGEADELGFRLLSAAGYAPEGAFALLRRLERLEQNSGALGQYFATHPAPSERIAKLARLNRPGTA